MKPEIRVIVMGSVWFLWIVLFFLNRSRGQGTAARIDPKARIGILLVAAAFFIANTHRPVVWRTPVDLWRAVLGIILGLIAIALAWTAVGNLGRQWRVDAGLNTDHQLIQSGAYRLVRHPIYLSILCNLAMTIAFAGTLPGWPIALVLGILGTEIRVRVEDNLLHGRFGERFTEWQQRVPAYLPFVR